MEFLEEEEKAYIFELIDGEIEAKNHPSVTTKVFHLN